jgi:hypothetical protein
MFFKKIVPSITALLFFVSFCSASEITSSLSKASLTAGEIITYNVTIIAPSGANVIPPVIDKTIGAVSIREWNSSTKKISKGDSVTVSYRITTYVPENCTIPELTYLVVNGSQTDTLVSPSHILSFQSVIDKDTADLRDLKPQLEAGTKPMWLLWILIAAAVLGVLIFVWFRFFNKKKIAGEKQIPLLPPYEEAINAINELERQKYLERGLIREYVFNLSEIVKRYIERRFDINASEFTTEEVVAWLGVSGLDKNLKQSVEWFFRTSDPVKFARFIPPQETIDRFMSETMNFLNSTRPVAVDNKQVAPDTTAPVTSNGSSK